MRNILLASSLLGIQAYAQQSQPNIIVVLADDLGYGDVSSYGSKTIHTPNIDRLANEGLRFTSGYATSATSTPSRYALMTGMYPWKNPLAKILQGDAPLIIAEDQLTLPRMLKNAGYKTSAIGKWHLGMGKGKVDWNKKVVPGANEIGFDYSCLIAATVDRVPTVYIENGHVVGLDKNDPLFVNYNKNFEGEPAARSNPELITMPWSHGHNNAVHNGIPRIGYQKGGVSARWVDEDMADYFVDKVTNYIQNTDDKPFFMYYGLHQPHVPRTPHSRFVGSSNMGPRGDAIIEADWCMGELIAALEKKGILENTIIIFSSDNGPVLNDGYKDKAVELLGNHKPAGVLRGGKYSLFEAGTRVPFIVFWKNTIHPGVSDAIVSQMDIMPSVAAILKLKNLPKTDGIDLKNALVGKSNKGRNELVLEANQRLAIRYKNYSMIPPYNGPTKNITNTELGNSQEFQLYNLTTDISQQQNISSQESKLATKIQKRFNELTNGYYNKNTDDLQLK